MRRSGVERKQQRAPATVPVRPMTVARPTDPYPDPSWSGWGDPSQRPVLSDEMRSLLAQGLGVSPPSRAAVSLAEVKLPASRLDPAAVSELTAVVGPEHARSDD